MPLPQLASDEGRALNNYSSLPAASPGSDDLSASLLKDISLVRIGLCQQDIEDIMGNIPAPTPADVRGMSFLVLLEVTEVISGLHNLAIKFRYCCWSSTPPSWASAADTCFTTNYQLVTKHVTCYHTNSQHLYTALQPVNVPNRKC